MIEVVAYDPSWPERFEALTREYSTALDRAGVAVGDVQRASDVLIGPGSGRQEGL